jgi:D-sedoheptulose 7-phosphate isomerase
MRAGGARVSEALERAVLRKAQESARVIDALAAESAPRLVACAQAMARAFSGGARLFTFGNGGSACDAQHVAVEFMHPIHAKRPPLPALALPVDTALLTAIGNDRDFTLGFVHQLRLHARAGDLALAISSSGKSANVNRALAVARELELTTIGFAGGDGGRMRELCDHLFVVPSFSIHRVQEAQQLLLHVLWDLVHLQRGEEDVI